ncbi:MAG TPA: phasin family protein [Stellaceae bacterium]|nr:phasin family protein [Stellaceae bacterium]
MAPPDKPAITTPPVPAPPAQIAATPSAPTPAPAAPPPATPTIAYGWAAFAEMQQAFARGFEEMTSEIDAMAKFGMSAATDAAVAMLSARNFADALEINTGLTQRGIAVVVESSVKLSETGIKAATAASRPLMVQIGAVWRSAETTR